MKSNYELDHLLYSGQFKPELHLLGSKQLNIKTIHPYFLRFSVPFTSLKSIVRQSFGHFHLELLEKPGIPELMTEAWNTLDSEINWNILDVDVYDSILLNLIQAVA